MTVKELRDYLVNLPDNMDVFISERKTDGAFGLLNCIVETQMFQEGTKDEIKLSEQCLVLSDY
jgi:hypothetical protein